MEFRPIELDEEVSPPLLAPQPFEVEAVATNDCAGRLAIHHVPGTTGFACRRCLRTLRGNLWRQDIFKTRPILDSPPRGPYKYEFRLPTLLVGE